MDITQADMWQPSTARPRPPGMRFPAMLLDARWSQGSKVQITMGRMQQLVINWRLISELWSLCSIKGKIAAEASGQIGNQPVMTLDLPSPQGCRSKITLDNLEASRSDCLAGFRHSRCDATPPFQRRPPRRMPR